jgi:O-acetyl-ADP-ribose deacetylase (regulator of RNase III)
MINYTKGNLLESQSQALINTVNTVGVMGKGIALQFKEAFQINYKPIYRGLQIKMATAREIAFCKGKYYTR